MKIDQVKTMKRIGKVIIRQKCGKFSGRKLGFEYDANLTKALKNDNRGRVYAIVVDGDIKKIGGSICEGGIASTMSFYFGGYAPKMSPRTYCVWNYMHRCIKEGKNVEIYCVWAPLVKVNIPTMCGEELKEVPVDFKVMENVFVSEFVRKDKKHPFLNMQESGRSWEDTDLFEGWPGMYSKKRKKAAKKNEDHLFE